MKFERSFIHNGCIAVVYTEKFDYPMRKPVNVEAILQEVAEEYGLPGREVTGRCRKPIYIAARHDFFYRALIALKGTWRGASWIGARYGFDHSTVLHGAARHAWRHDLKCPTKFNLDSRLAKREGHV